MKVRWLPARITGTVARDVLHAFHPWAEHQAHDRSEHCLDEREAGQRALRCQGIGHGVCAGEDDTRGSRVIAHRGSSTGYALLTYVYLRLRACERRTRGRDDVTDIARRTGERVTPPRIAARSAAVPTRYPRPPGRCRRTVRIRIPYDIRRHPRVPPRVSLPSRWRHLRSARFDRQAHHGRRSAHGSAGVERVRSGAPARRALLGAAVLGRGRSGPRPARHRESRRGRTRTGAAGYRSLPRPTVIGHRGASGYRPEHTFGSYQLALDLGADVVEPGPGAHQGRPSGLPARAGDRRDHRVADHPEFAGRRTTKTLDGVATTGWFTEDFTLAELKTLRAVERIPPNRQHNTLYNGRWEIPTFEEVLDAGRTSRPASAASRSGIYPETKHPTYFRGARPRPGGAAREAAAPLRQGQADSPVILQSFEPSSIQRLDKLVGNPAASSCCPPRTPGPGTSSRRATRAPSPTSITPEGLKWIAVFAQGIGPTLDLVIPKDADGSLDQADHPGRRRAPRGPDPAPVHHAQREPLPARRASAGAPTADAYGDAFGAFKVVLRDGHRRRLLRQRGHRGCWPARTSSRDESGTRAVEDASGERDGVRIRQRVTRSPRMG